MKPWRADARKCAACSRYRPRLGLAGEVTLRETGVWLCSEACRVIYVWPGAGGADIDGRHGVPR